MAGLGARRRFELRKGVAFGEGFGDFGLADVDCIFAAVLAVIAAWMTNRLLSVSSGVARSRILATCPLTLTTGVVARLDGGISLVHVA